MMICLMYWSMVSWVDLWFGEWVMCQSLRKENRGLQHGDFPLYTSCKGRSHEASFQQKIAVICLLSLAPAICTCFCPWFSIVQEADGTIFRSVWSQFRTKSREFLPSEQLLSLHEEKLSLNSLNVPLWNCSLLLSPISRQSSFFSMNAPKNILEILDPHFLLRKIDWTPVRCHMMLQWQSSTFYNFI